MAPRLPSRPASKGGKSGRAIKQSTDIKKSRPKILRGPRNATQARPHTLGWRLHKLRKELKLTQLALAREVGVVQATVSAWECGIVAPDKIPLRTLRLLAQALGVSVAYLREGREAQDAAAEHLGPDRVSVSLPSPAEGTEVLRVARQGLAAEALSLAQAQRALREAVKGGHPVWLVVG